MTPLDGEESGHDDPRRFEQWLLDSARTDELPRDVSGAWARFGASLASVGAFDVTSTAARGGRAPAALQPAAQNIAAAAVARGTRLVAVKWLFVGLLAGSTLTALGLSRARDWRRLDPSRTENAPLAARVVPPVVTGNAWPAAAADADADAGSGAAAAPPPTRSSTLARVTPHARLDSGPNRSTLGAQVALLDSARAALASAAFATALRETERFEREFPAGELAPEAEVVAIEALAARGDHEALSVRADRFLLRYPADPHAARVKALAGR